MPDNRSLHETEDLGIDWVMKMSRNTAPIQDSPPFVWLDIDEYTYQQWQEPLLTPRDKLLKLLQFAVEGQPKVIIVDIDLSYPTNRASDKLNPADQALSDFFAQYDARCPNSGCPHILLVRTFRQSLAADGHPDGLSETGGVGEWITIWHRDEEEETRQVSAGGKGNADDSDVPPYLKLLILPKRPHQTMQVTAGIKPLYFAWAGGTPPYHLEITRNQKTLVSLSGIPARRTHTQQPLLLKRGDYRVIVRDANKQKSVEYTFTIVDNKPSYPPALKHASMPELTRLTLQAAWLAAQDRGIWAFEAYQLVAPIAQHYQPARVLRYALEKGEHVVEPK